MSIEVIFWGVRGSVACASEPYVKYGGHTSCVSVRHQDHLVIFDAGTGLRDLNPWIDTLCLQQTDLLFSHFHFDHIMGLPFFRGMWDAGFKLTLHGASADPARQLTKLLQEYVFTNPLFPVTLEAVQDNVILKDHSVPDCFDLRPQTKVYTQKLNHPGHATGYRLEIHGKIISYITDTEHIIDQTDAQVVALMEKADLAIYDATYTAAEHQNKKGWGHSTWQEGIRLAKLAGVKRLALFHHSPDHTDVILDQIEREAQAEFVGCFMAKQGSRLILS